MTEEKGSNNSKETTSYEYQREVRHIDNDNVNAKLANPLYGIPHDQLMADAAQFAEDHGLGHLKKEFEKGALVAQDPSAFESLTQLSEDDKNILRRETRTGGTSPGNSIISLSYVQWLLQFKVYMDETVINGANLFFASQLGIPQEGPDQSRNEWLLGLVNGAPYLCCGVIACWLTAPLNSVLGRRGTIFLTAFVSFASCIWQGVTNSWQHLFVARLVLGFGIGPKSTTVPVYAAECAPPVIRGALVMMWQMWTAFGIMLGYVMDLAFYHVPDKPHITGLNWRLMLASAGVPALFIMAQVYFCPESPRWLISKGRYDKAYESLRVLRRSSLQAARDLFYIHVLLEAEKDVSAGRNRVVELFTVPRNRRALLASTIVMFMQQFCGVNAVAYYSSTVFTQAGFAEQSALLASFGFGLVNWLFAFPAVYTIDTFGRRNLLLTTFPFMAIFMLLMGFSYWAPPGSGRLAGVALGMYLFGIAYSPGEGPVPFTYSAEAYPLYVRDIGMSWATSVLWFFNFIVAITFPRLLGAFTPQGAFGWYGAWNIVGFILVLLFVPETKELSLEELDQVFSVPTHVHAAYQVKALPRNIKKHIFRMKVEDVPPLYEHEGGMRTYAPGGSGHA